MSFHNENIIKDAISDLKDILIRSQLDSHESLKLIGQLEATVLDIHQKFTVMTASGLVIPTPAQPIIF